MNPLNNLHLNRYNLNTFKAGVENHSDRIRPGYSSNRIPVGKNLRVIEDERPKSLKKTSSDYEIELRNVLQNTGLVTVRSVPKLPFGSSKVFKNDSQKIESIKHQYWESKYQEKIQTSRSQKKKVRFLLDSPKSEVKQVDYTRALNEDILDFEKRLDEYKNKEKNSLPGSVSKIYNL